MLQYLVFKILSLVAPLLPPGPAYWLCDRLGDVAYHLLARRRKIVERNLQVVLGGETQDLRRRAREVFRQGARYYYDTFRIPAMSDADLERVIVMEGWGNLEGALERGKGAIVATAHFGSPALVAQILRIRGYQVTTVAEPVKPQKLFDLINGVRGSRGIRFLPLGPTSARDLAEVLRRNEVVGIVGDRDIQKNGLPVEIFGATTTFPAGPVALALRTGAPLMPAFTYRRGDGLFTAQIQEPLELERTGDLRRDVRRNTERLARAMEGAIARSPEQWIVFEPIWPEGETRHNRGDTR